MKLAQHGGLLHTTPQKELMTLPKKDLASFGKTGARPRFPWRKCEHNAAGLATGWYTETEDTALGPRRRDYAASTGRTQLRSKLIYGIQKDTVMAGGSSEAAILTRRLVFKLV